MDRKRAGFSSWYELFPRSAAPDPKRHGKFKDVAPPRTNPQFLAAFHKATEDVSKSTVRVLCDDKEAALGTVTKLLAGGQYAVGGLHVVHAERDPVETAMVGGR